MKSISGTFFDRLLNFVYNINHNDIRAIGGLDEPLLGS